MNVLLDRAKAPSDITKWSPGTSKVFFKVAQDGKDASGVWATPTKLAQTNSIYTFTVPASLASVGQYTAG